jgi:hypothetical protein
MTQSIRSFLSKFGPKIASSTKNQKLCRTVSGLDQKHIETSSYIDKNYVDSLHKNNVSLDKKNIKFYHNCGRALRLKEKKTVPTDTKSLMICPVSTWRWL